MNTMITPALFTREKSYTVLDNLEVGISVEESFYHLSPGHLFAMAARNNAKRSYLFVSKLIGKHIPVHPRVPFITGYLLASRLAQTLGLPVSKKAIAQAVSCLTHDMAHFFKPQPYHWPGKTLFVGFAETATALGHSVFGSFSGNTGYLHTTRENIKGFHDTVYFTEDHCHAPDQRLLINSLDIVKDNELVVLIDDEVTSGNTCLNIIKSIHAKYPQPKYIILTILDWRSKDFQEKFRRMEQELGAPIEVLFLLKGRFWSKGNSPVVNSSFIATGGAIPQVHILQPQLEPQIELINSNGEKVTYLGYTGRFGLTAKDNSNLLVKAGELGEKLCKIRQGNKTLCLGTGEFMYLPFLIASFMGDGVRVQSTTRSPVHPLLKKDYAVQYAITFEDPFNPGIKNFVYNIPPGCYDEVFVFWERRALPQQAVPLVQSFKQLGIDKIHFVSLCN